MMSPKLATLVLLKTKVFWNKDYDIIIFVYEVTNKFLSPESNYVVTAVMWTMFGKLTSMREVNTTSIF